MYIRNNILHLLIVSSLLFGQSLKNGFGPGNVNRSNNAAALGIASSGIIPGYNQDVSLDNPSTWSNLNFSIISTGYGVREIGFGLDGLVTGSSHLSMVQMIIPFKSMLSMGVEFKPYSSQYLNITDNDVTSKGIPSSLGVASGGGLSSVSFALGGKVGEFEAFGVDLEYIYGSNRKEYSLSFDDRTFAKVDKYIYSGILLSLFGHTKRFTLNGNPAGVYIKTQIALAPISAEEQSIAPYEDNNESGYYDQTFPDFDYPNPLWMSETVTSVYSSVHKPISIGYGVDYQLNPYLKIAQEGLLYWENGTNVEMISVFGDYIDMKKYFSLSILSHGSRNGRNLLDKIIFRSGLFIEQNTLKFSRDSFNEKGLNLGLGFKFGRFDNQIDLGYSLGFRSEYGDLPDERIQNLSLTLSLGDLWFVKRRER